MQPFSRRQFHCAQLSGPNFLPLYSHSLFSLQLQRLHLGQECNSEIQSGKWLSRNSFLCLDIRCYWGEILLVILLVATESSPGLLSPLVLGTVYLFAEQHTQPPTQLRIRAKPDPFKLQWNIIHWIHWNRAQQEGWGGGWGGEDGQPLLFCGRKLLCSPCIIK